MLGDLTSSYNAQLGPCITLYLAQEKIVIQTSSIQPGKHIIFPIKICGETTHHLNVILLNTKTHVVKRFEPNYVLPHIDSWIEAVLNSLMEKGNIYFLKYELVSDDKDENCGYHCLNFVQNEFVQLNQSAIINNGKYKRYDNTAWVL